MSQEFKFPMEVLKLVVVTLLLTLINNKIANGTSDNPLLTYESLYKDGVSAYLENNWGSCIKYLELTINDYNWWKKTTARCRKQCYKEANSTQQVFPEAYSYDRIFEKAIITTLCLVKCKKEYFGSRPEKYAPSDIDKDIENRKHYDYLQLCYFKMGHLDDAANAAATFLALHPDHEIMQQNIKYYVQKGGLRAEDIVNLELEEYAKLYIEGDYAYQEEDYQTTILYFEKSLTLFWDALEVCRLLCEDQFDQGWSPEFIASVANHYTFALRCKRKCPERLSNFYGDKIDNFVASIFHYLQFSYFKVGDAAKSCEAVESFLTLVPDDPSQLRNKQFLWSTDGIEAKFFTPRMDVLSYKDREDKENELMKYIVESFVFVDSSTPEGETVPVGTIFKEELAKVQALGVKTRQPVLSNVNPSTSLVINKSVPITTAIPHSGPHLPTSHPSSRKQRNKRKKYDKAVAHLMAKPENKSSVAKSRQSAVNYFKKFSDLKIKLLADEKVLNGSQRVLASGFLTEEQCWHLTQFTQKAAFEGDGYPNGINPHTESENFEGVTLSRAAMLVHAGYEEPKMLRLILGAGNFTKEFIERHYRLEQPLYFSFTHLVCRSSKSDKSNRSISDLSHSIHADNCIIQLNGKCLKIPPAYTFRDYSAILYLNDDFEGGEFIFSDDQKGVKFQSMVRPQCGHVVAFSAGQENPHGVRPVTRGHRCAMAMWFTFQKKHKEMERDLAQTLLDRLESGEIKQGEIP